MAIDIDLHVLVLELNIQFFHLFWVNEIAISNNSNYDISRKVNGSVVAFKRF